MNYKKCAYTVTLLCIFSLHANAEEYKTGNLSPEEYQRVSDAQADHADCMNETAISRAEGQTDFRAVADIAMKECAPVLEELYKYLVAQNYAPDPMRRFVSSISNKGANELLRNLMVYMAQQNPQ